MLLGFPSLGATAWIVRGPFERMLFVVSPSISEMAETRIGPAFPVERSTVKTGRLIVVYTRIGVVLMYVGRVDLGRQEPKCTDAKKVTWKIMFRESYLILLTPIGLGAHYSSIIPDSSRNFKG